MYDLSLWEVPVLLSAIVSSVEHSDPSNIDHEHCRAEYVTCLVGCELDASILTLFVKVDQFYAVHCLVDVFAFEDLVLGCNLAHTSVVMPQQFADRPRRVRHED